MEELKAFSNDVHLPSHVTTLMDPKALTQPAAVPTAGMQQYHGQGTSSDALDTQDTLAAAQSKISDDYEPPNSDADPLDEHSSLAEIANESELQRGGEVAGVDMAMRTISTGKVPSRDPTYGQRTETAREVHIVYPARIDKCLTDNKAADASLPKPKALLGSYESPLRYFHAFRFHPGYHEGVSGGLKSLTFSNRIDPKKEMCPDEWEGNDCPRGEACQFQHFQDIVPPGEFASPIAAC